VVSSLSLVDNVEVKMSIAKKALFSILRNDFLYKLGSP
jgi:hypothetical protein